MTLFVQKCSGQKEPPDTPLRGNYLKARNAGEVHADFGGGGSLQTSVCVTNPGTSPWDYLQELELALG